MLTLNHANYHSLKANREFMSHSLYSRFLRCEANALAYLRGDYEDAETTAQQVGAYVDLRLTRPHEVDAWLAARPTLRTQKGELKADIRAAEEMVCAFNMNYGARTFLTDRTQFQTICYGRIDNVWWKCMLDAVSIDLGIIIDLKTCADIHRVEWSDEYGGKVPWYVASHYWRQMAVYAHIAKQFFAQELTPHLLAISKQEPPAIRGYRMADSWKLSTELDTIRKYQPRIKSIMAGDTEPVMCERCAYCRAVMGFQIDEADNLAGWNDGRVSIAEGAE